MAGARGHPPRGEARRLRQRLQPVGEGGVEARGGQPALPVDLEEQAVGGGGPGDLRLAGRGERLHPRLPRVPPDDREPRLAGHRVGEVRGQRRLPHRNPRVGPAGAGEDRGDRRAEVGHPAEGVAAHVHRRRAGVVGLALQRHGPVEDAGDRLGHADVVSGPLQHRALLDMQLQEAGDVGEVPGRPRRRLRRGVEAGLGQRLAQRPAGVVAGAGDPLRPHLPADRLAAEHAAEAPLLVGGRDHLDGAAGGNAGVLHRPHRLQRRQHPQRAVEGPAVGHRVEMRADEHRGPLPRLPPPEDVPDRVHPRREARGLHPLHQPAPPGHVLRREGDPVDPRPAGDAAEVVDRLDVGAQAGEVDARPHAASTAPERGAPEGRPSAQASTPLTQTPAMPSAGRTGSS